jgi:hypothetical protein
VAGLAYVSNIIDAIKENGTKLDSKRQENNTC